MATTSYGTPYVQSSDLVSGWPTASLNVADRIDAVSYAGNGLNAQTGTTYTLVVGDAGKTVTLSNAAAVAVTLPQDSVANLPTGAVVNFYNLGAGTVTISAGAGATLQGGSLTATQYGYAAVIKLSANTYGPYQPVPIVPGMVPIAPTSIANTGGTASTSSYTTTFTGVTAISVNGVFSSTYANYRIVWRLDPSANVITSLRFRTSGSDNTNASYYYAEYGASWAGTARLGGSGGGTSTLLTTTDAGHSPSTGSFDVIAPFATYNTGWNGTTAFSQGASSIAGFFNATTSFDGITIYATSAFDGTIAVYAYRP